MRLRVARAVTVLTLIAGSAVSAGAPEGVVSAALPSPVTAAFLDGEAGSPLIASHVDFPSVTGGSLGPSILKFDMAQDGHWFTLMFAAPPGEALGVGIYESAERAPFRSAGHPGLDVFGDGRGCNTSSGRFIVDEVEVNDVGEPIVFSARFEHHCENYDAAVFGAISFNASADYRSRSVSQNTIDFGESLGSPVTGRVVTVTNLGPSALHVAGAYISGDDTTEFFLVPDGCTEVSLGVGQSCSMTVSFTPSAAIGPRSAKLRIFDDIAPWGGGGGGRDVELIGVRQSAFGEFTSLTPSRILDTRDGTGRGGLIQPLGPNEEIEVQISGRGGVPATGIAAVVLNATVTDPTQPSYLTVWPAGLSRPEISNLNYPEGTTVPNLVTVAVGRDGKVSAYNFAGSANVIFDVVGVYAADSGSPGSRFHSVDPHRIFDTRDGTGSIPASPIGPNQALKFNVLGRGGVPAAGVTAVVMNVTATQPTEQSYLTVYPDDVATLPVASNLNYGAGQSVPNLVTVRVPTSGVVDFYNRFGTTHVVADLVGYYDGDRSSEAGRFIPLAPSRSVDTRLTGSPLGPDDWNWLEMAGWDGVPSSGSGSVVINTTVTQPTMPSYLTVFPDDNCDIPLASNLNFTTNQTIANLVIVRLSQPENWACISAPGAIDIYNAFGTVHVIVDVFGYFTNAKPYAALSDQPTNTEAPDLSGLSPNHLAHTDKPLPARATVR